MPQHPNHVLSHPVLVTLIASAGGRRAGLEYQPVEYQGAEHTNDRSGVERRSGINSYPGGRAFF